MCKRIHWEHESVKIWQHKELFTGEIDLRANAFAIAPENESNKVAEVFQFQHWQRSGIPIVRASTNKLKLSQAPGH